MGDQLSNKVKVAERFAIACLNIPHNPPDVAVNEITVTDFTALYTNIEISEITGSIIGEAMQESGRDGKGNQLLSGLLKSFVCVLIVVEGKFDRHEFKSDELESVFKMRMLMAFCYGMGCDPAECKSLVADLVGVTETQQRQSNSEFN